MYEFASDALHLIPKTEFDQVDFRERHDMQWLLRENLAVIAPVTLVLAEGLSD